MDSSTLRGLLPFFVLHLAATAFPRLSRMGVQDRTYTHGVRPRLYRAVGPIRKSIGLSRKLLSPVRSSELPESSMENDEPSPAEIEQYKLILNAIEDLDKYVKRQIAEKGGGPGMPSAAMHNLAVMKTMLGGGRDAELDLRQGIEWELTNGKGQNTPCLAIMLRSLASVLAETQQRTKEAVDALNQSKMIWAGLYTENPSYLGRLRLLVEELTAKQQRLLPDPEISKLHTDENPPYPAVRLWDGILTPEECKQIIEFVDDSQRLKEALTVSGGEEYVDKSEYDAYEMTAKVWEHPNVMDLAMRISALTGISLSQIEDINVVKFDTLGFASPRFDFSPPSIELGLQGRLSTVHVFLNDDFEGGSTSFPRLGDMEIEPKTGRAIWFGNKNPFADEAHPKSMYRCSAVGKGTKYMLQVWIRSIGWRNELVWGQIPPIADELCMRTLLDMDVPRVDLPKPEDGFFYGDNADILEEVMGVKEGEEDESVYGPP
ncbi:hypothetical protein AAMO2058_000860600 [Amorphochlora amoebiformis]|uniref:Prolyl 4-hydroxylase alpha subunit domain-containing protein n=1 Tax=Amorphochlora amoebiformis TaxID=1561963 RepID=A0A7S0DQ22_9EUKA|mmetsp:Transcript_5668/g.8691  ORF Transcript_5668/g.8691 Transcript_5668/m.8691 type:complete len:488 (+) Transcript_5668:2-1465(+)